MEEKKYIEPLYEEEEYDEIDIMELLRKLFSEWRLILKWCGIAAVVGLVIGFSIPKEYTVESKMAPESVAKGAGGSLGSLASLAGISLGSMSSDDAVYPDLYPDIMKSTPFIVELFPVQVDFKHKKELMSADYYTYLKEYTRSPWWSGVISAPFKALGWFMGLFREKTEPVEGYADLNPKELTEEQEEIAKSIRKSIALSVDKKTSVLVLTVTAQDPWVAARISEEAIALVRGRQRTLTVNSEKAKPVWNSSNPTVAAVNESGIVQGLTAGLSLITATWKGYTASCYVSVLGISTEALINTGKPKLSNLGRIVLAGSSSMDLWYSAPQAFAPYKVLNMAVGGSKVSDWLKWYPDMIVRYKPSAVVLYVGANDLANGNGVRGADNAQNTIALLNQLSSRLKDVPIYYVGVCPCHIRKGAWQEIAMSNSLVSSYCNVTKNVYYLDLPSKIVRSDGTPDPELFLPDKLHPSTKGYLVWKEHVAGPVKKNLKKSTKKSGKS